MKEVRCVMKEREEETEHQERERERENVGHSYKRGMDNWNDLQLFWDES